MTLRRKRRVALDSQGAPGVVKLAGLALVALLASTQLAGCGPMDGIIRQDGRGHLTLNGSVYQFTGVNGFELSTYWPVNIGCGSQQNDLDGFFSTLRPNDVVRFWAFEQLGTNKNTGAIDFTGIDRVVAAAERTHQRLIISLGNQWADCDGSPNGLQKDQAWYDGGYRTTRPPGEPVAYRDWVSMVVDRYKASPAVGMWEPLNEPEAGCAPKYGAQILRAFFDDIGGLIKAHDPQHLVESGVIGGNQCSLAGTDSLLVHASPGIDVISYHDYGDASPMPANLQYRLDQARQLNKPLITGEVGWLNDCPLMVSKSAAQLAAGVSGFLPWNRDDTSMSACGL